MLIRWVLLIAFTIFMLLLDFSSLDDHQQVFAAWGAHDFIFLGANTQKCEVIAGVKVSDGASCFLCQAAQEASILHCGRVVQSRTDWNAILVDDNGANDTFVTLYPFEYFFYVAHFDVWGGCQYQTRKEFLLLRR
eukprot:GHVL01004529.1.p1 GENE.GHVL01004529.1~~GHVL01004529.1.p1  ORF type:complete len:135 (-),score=3.95 GHVL01004529.1:15-419(-)